MANEVRVTEGPEDAFDWAAAAADEGFDVVLAGGGDGTVTGVAHGVLRSGSRIPIGILPLGTGNGMARVLGLPVEPSEALDALAQGRIVQVDAVDIPSHDAMSLLFFGAGLDARINREADGDEKARLGPFAYVVAALSKLRGIRNHSLTLTIDGRLQALRGHTVSVFNATRLDLGGVPVGPDADPHDGVLELTVLRSSGALSTLGKLARLLNRSASRGELVPVHKLRVEADPPLPVQVDGDVVGETPLEAEVLPWALRFIADRGYAGNGAADTTADTTADNGATTAASRGSDASCATRTPGVRPPSPRRASGSLVSA